MDRQIVYAGAIPLETDLLNTNRNTLTAIGALIQDVFGTNTLFSGLACVPATPAAMSVIINPGRAYSLQFRDPLPYSSLAADTTNQIMKQGILLAAQTFAIAAPATAGFSQNYLISASFVEQDITPVVLPYYNATNPAQAFSGPPINGVSSGTAQNTTRQDTISLVLTPGVAAATGTQATPATPVGTTALWVVTVANGQTTITAANIAQVAGAPILASDLLSQIEARITLAQAQGMVDTYLGFVSYSVPTTLSRTDSGKLIGASATTLTLPLAATWAPAAQRGDGFTIESTASVGNSTTVNVDPTGGTDHIQIGGTAFTSIIIPAGQSVRLTRITSVAWEAQGTAIGANIPLVIAPATGATHAVQLGQVQALTAGRLLNVQTFSANATYTPTTGTNKILVRMVGGGGGGGGTVAAGASQVSAGGGGGAGAYAEAEITAGFSGAAISIGAGGAGGTSSIVAGNGGVTSLGSLVSASGGSGGTVSTSFSSFPAFIGGSTGGQTIVGGNFIAGKGDSGGGSLMLNSAAAESGFGGASVFGGGGEARATGGSGSAPGVNATTPGAGGSGALSLAGASGGTGGAGATGILIIEEYS